MLNNDTSPKVSIILPTYNREGFILDAVNSVCNQTYSNWELLIVDDGSSDNTVLLISQVKDERIQLHRTASRLGITGTRNEGIRKVNGDMIAFIDSDDLWAPAKLEEQVAALNLHPEAGFCLTGGYNFKKLNQPLSFYYTQTEGLKCDDLFISFFRSEISATTPSLIFRKECLESTGLFNEEKLFADVDFILRLALHFKGIILYAPLLYRRLHDSNISGELWEEGCEEGLRLIQSYKHMLPPKVARDALFRLYISFGEKYLLHKRRKSAMQVFLKAWQNKPFSVIPLRKTAKAILYRMA